MKVEIGLKEIPIFKHLQKDQALALAKTFDHKVLAEGKQLMRLGGLVPGIYVVLKGTLGVYGNSKKALLATIKRGETVGEMSLIERGQTSSANVYVTSEECQTLFLGTSDFHQKIANDSDFALSFFRGASELLSKRLRGTNEQIQKQMSIARSLIAEVMDQSDLSNAVDSTRKELIKVGDNVMQNILTEVIPKLNSLLTECTDRPEFRGKLENEITSIERVLINEGQHFDILSQKLDLVFQVINNITCILNDKPPKKLIGDQKLLTKLG